MGINETIKNRRATPPRLMTKEMIPDEIILQLLENANWAPNHKKTEPWRFKIYTNRAKEKLADDIFEKLTNKVTNVGSIDIEKVEKLINNIKNVPVVILIIVENDLAKRIPEWEEIAAVAMAVQNMWLTATEKELGAFWASPQFLPLLNDIFELKPNQKALGFFYVGRKKIDFPSPGRGNISLKVVWENEV